MEIEEKWKSVKERLNLDSGKMTLLKKVTRCSSAAKC